MGLFSTIKEKVKEKAQEVKTWATSKFNEIKNKCITAVTEVRVRTEVWGARAKQYISNGMKRLQGVYSPEEADIKTAERCRDVVREFFPSGVQQTLISQSPQQRVQTFSRLVDKAASAMNLSRTPELHFFNPSPEESTVMGFFNRHEHTLNLNVAMIACSDPKMMEEQVYTVLHELMHARQWEAVKGLASIPPQNKFGYSIGQIVVYALNFANYVNPHENPEAYSRQPLERDAFGFERRVKSLL